MNKLSLPILHYEKLLKNKQKTIEDQGKKQVDALKTLESLKPSDKQLPSTRDFISKERLNSEIVNEIERIEEEEEEERKVGRSKMVYKASNET